MENLDGGNFPWLNLSGVLYQKVSQDTRASCLIYCVKSHSLQSATSDFPGATADFKKFKC